MMPSTDPAAPPARGNPIRLPARIAEAAIVVKRGWTRSAGQAFGWHPGLLDGVPDGETRLGPTLGRLGPLEVRLATRPKDIRRAQRLRYKVFYEEGSALPGAAAMLSRRDVDLHDAFCDHILVVDHDVPRKAFRPAKPKVVGTYRLMRQDRAEQGYGFYSAGEYDIAPLLDGNPGLRFLELGRSCVLRPWRNKRTLELLWHGVWTYVLHHRVDAMIGCASLEGTDPSRLALPLSFLHHYAASPGKWRVRALAGSFSRMDLIDREAIDPRAALAALPPLIKGYLRLGATFGDGAVVDHQFGTTDVFVVLPVADISARHIGHFGANAERYAVRAPTASPSGLARGLRADLS